MVVSIHCGSRGLGHQIGTEFLKTMAVSAARYQIHLPDRELACAPINSDVGQEYLRAMRAAMNCALANRQIITHLVRQAFAELLPQADLRLLYDVSHNTCKLEDHVVDGNKKRVFVHRKGATRAFGPGHPDLPPVFRETGQPVLIGGTMGTASYVLVGTREGMELAFGSACHGAGRSMSRHQALRQWQGRDVGKELGLRGIVIRSPSLRGVAEEAPGAYKDVSAVVRAADEAHLAGAVARLEPIVCIKGKRVIAVVVGRPWVMALPAAISVAVVRLFERSPAPVRCQEWHGRTGWAPSPARASASPTVRPEQAG